ncbi:hypothetical protein LSTR_LSTR014652 [Laodelphax striatellus]|uniref:Uncharacterized protein n=1 Tax=Laodelphax striatellus TaxID=195883 RepID=A0A482XEI3_LAOST|nr:hypothetical protein LSTR_LSTR014652 [Laodelphax striatellus]
MPDAHQEKPAHSGNPTDVHHTSPGIASCSTFPGDAPTDHRPAHRISALKFYNKLPVGVKQLDGAAFERAMKKLLRQKAYYSIGEFMGDALSFD